MQLKDQVEIVVAVSAMDLEKSKVRGDLGITYDSDVLRLIDAFRSKGLYVGSVVVTQYTGQAAADSFRLRLEKLGVRVYRHYSIQATPTNIAHIVSDEGYGKNDYIETSRLWWCHRTRSRQRQDGHLPQPALSPLPPGGDGATPSSRPSPSGTSP